jgi:hypothetical protein
MQVDIGTVLEFYFLKLRSGEHGLLAWPLMSGAFEIALGYNCATSEKVSNLYQVKEMSN